jgi:uncharacterized protein YqgC (DUF456 family)
MNWLLYTLAYFVIMVGFAGSILPVLPGPLLIWAGILLWAWVDGFARLGWPSLTILGVLALTAAGLDFALTTTLSRRAGVSWRAIGGAIVGALIGAITLSFVPILGTIFGGLVGAIVGMWLVEDIVRKDSRAATKAVRAYLTGATISTAVTFGIALLMIAIFVWQAFGY